MARRDAARRRRHIVLYALISVLAGTGVSQLCAWTRGWAPAAQSSVRCPPRGAVASEGEKSDATGDPPDLSSQARESERVSSPPLAAKTQDDVDPWTYFFGRPGEFERDLGLLNVSPARFFTAGFLAVVIGLTANLWGETEFFLGLIPAAGQAARELKLDSIYAVDGLKGYYEQQYQLRYPSTWLFDQRIALAKFGQLDNNLLTSNGPRGLPKSAAGVLPDAAWGPAGGGQRSAKERENLSVVKQLLGPGSPSKIEDILGEPEASLEKLLRETIAPEGSKRRAESLKALRVSRPTLGADGVASSQNTYYEYEWRTSFDAGFALRSYSSAALGPADEQGRRFLYTLTVVLPESEAAAGEGAAKFVPEVLASFRVAG